MLGTLGGEVLASGKLYGNKGKKTHRILPKSESVALDISDVMTSLPAEVIMAHMCDSPRRQPGDSC